MNKEIKNKFLIESLEMILVDIHCLKTLNSSQNYDHMLLSQIQRTLHTIKGNASFFVFENLVMFINDSENYIRNYIENNLSDSSFHLTMCNVYKHLTNELLLIEAESQELLEKTRFDSLKINKNESIIFNKLFISSIKDTIAKLKEYDLSLSIKNELSAFLAYMGFYIQKLAIERGLKVEFFRGEDIELNPKYLSTMKNILIQLIHNSFEHSFIDNKEYFIKLDIEKISNETILNYSDNGRGFDKSKILATGIACGIIDKNDNLSDRDLFNLVYLPNFSTNKNENLISGQGMGLNIIHKLLTDIDAVYEFKDPFKNGIELEIRIKG